HTFYSPSLPPTLPYTLSLHDALPIFSQMSVMEIFDETTSEFMPRYFVDEAESLEWLNTPRKRKEIAQSEPPTILIDRVNDKIKLDRKSTRLNSSHVKISYAVFCLTKK